MARDKYHDLIRQLLEDDGWTITHDPLIVRTALGNVEIDLPIAVHRLQHEESKNHFMDRISEYTEIITSVLTEIFDRYAKASDGVEYQFIIDEKSNNFLIITDGWINESRFYGILIHIQVKEDGRVWLYDDNTDLIVVDWLLERGIPKNDIVLGWHAPSMRPDTEFAVT